MKSQTIFTPLAFLVLVGVANVSNGADEKVTSDPSNAENVTPLNSLVVETDHGQGLGPNGTDLHYENDEKVPASEDAELFLKSLEEPTPVDTDMAIEEHAADAISANTDDSER